MKKLVIIISTILISIASSAQIPFFGTTVGDNKVYAYFQWKVHPGINSQSFYTSVKYGVYDRGDLSFSYNDSDGYNVTSIGWTQNILMHDNINIAIQPMFSFNMRNSFKFSDLCTGLYLHGNIVGGLGYDLNTWWTVYRDGTHDVSQWSYLTYSFKNFYPMIGAVTSCMNAFKTDLALGFYFPIASSTYIYIWTANVTRTLGPNRVILGIDFKF